MRSALPRVRPLHKARSLSRGCGILLVVLLLVPACSREKDKKQAMPNTAPVLAAMAQQRDVPLELSDIGTVEAYSTVSIRAQVGGQLSRIHFREGQEVKTGDLLFTIDPRPFEAELRQAEATLAKDAAQMRHAREEERRYAELVKKGYVAQSQYEQVRANADALEAVVRADRAQVENAKLQLSYCFIHAPISGRTGSLLVNEGNLVRANDDRALVVIHQIEPVYVNFALPEKHLAEIKKHMASGKLAVRADIPQHAGKPVEGVLTFVDNAVDRATGTIRLKATFDNRERQLWPGQFVNVTLRLAVLSNMVTVPSPAVQTGQQGHFIYVIQPDMSVEARPVVAGTTYGGETVIEKGLGPNERVVIDGQIRLFPGAKVEIKGGEPAQATQGEEGSR
ncbi:MAG: efflux RND transporter periplasmic adaptor subunit [Alphaproteobacteria bacterium]|uniref:Efflux RND transporter periplasmic adaptor subunit n=1 Tax=Candidatus Nitrobium versatile TaxID=2884831 RepID=A0A953JCZ7_9BACT|nr:efflux RND transporter periplasmic adaptor subunit [Candidatus Nitrobium versatile]